MSALAQDAVRADGSIVERAPCPKFSAPAYDEFVANVKRLHAQELEAAKREGLTMTTPPGIPLTREAFERAMETSARVECTRIVYMSDGLKVAGLMWRPVDQGTRRLPLLIYNRGGNRDFGKNAPWNPFHRFAAEGFVMLAPQYRGVDGGEGVEEFGGADIHDIVNLLPVARSLGNVDLDNVFVLGWSRGAMSTLVALKRGLNANAVAVGGGLFDLTAEARRRPAVVKNVWSELMPGFATRRDELLLERSAVHWPEQISAPVLILHGTGDWRASPADALVLAQKLQSAGKPYELIVYANDDHSLNANAVDRNRRIIEWFRKHMR